MPRVNPRPEPKRWVRNTRRRRLRGGEVIRNASGEVFVVVRSTHSSAAVRPYKKVQRIVHDRRHDKTVIIETPGGIKHIASHAEIDILQSRSTT